jgi:DNA-binding NtrC family response regulator
MCIRDSLEEEVARGRFRGDLYYRLNVVSLQIPTLVERPKDITVLARHFADKYAEANALERKEISPEAMRALLGHRWPGNVRELENTMHRAVLLAPGSRIEADAIVLSGSPGAAGTRSEDGGNGLAIGRTVADVERDLIIDTLRHCFGNRTHAATILGISIRTLRNKLRQYLDEGVAVPPPRERRDLEQAAL